jgi:hypothetical protein
MDSGSIEATRKVVNFVSGMATLVFIALLALAITGWLM